jgi:hypothetical protein
MHLHRTPLLAPLAVAGLLAACSSPSSPSSSATSSTGTSSPSSAPSASASLTVPTVAPTSSAAPTPSGPQECTASQLQGALDTNQGAAGSIYTGWEVRNSSSVSCTLDGYFGVQMSSNGTQDPASYTPTSGNGVSPTLVVLPPNTAPVNSGNDVGHAVFYMRWNDVCDTPAQPDAFEFTPPQLSGAFTVSVASAHFEACSPLEIGPISPRGAANPFAG